MEVGQKPKVGRPRLYSKEWLVIQRLKDKKAF